jgi:cold shock CspA family protein
MQKNPYLIALLSTLLLAYPVRVLTNANYSLTAADFLTSILLIATLSLVSALLARPRNATKNNLGNRHSRSRSKAPRKQTTVQGNREQGEVKWFNSTKGFGFITRDSGEDIFVHFRSIRGEGHRTLKDGERVDFVVTDGDKGLQADDVISF